MRASFRNRPLSTGSRLITYGGLGGCIDLTTDPLPTGPRPQSVLGRKKSRRKPSPIEVAEASIPEGPRTSPITRLDAPLPATPSVPFGPDDIKAPANTPFDVKTPKAFELWDRGNDNPWSETKPNRQTWAPPPLKRHQTLPIELPGSLLLPSQGYVQKDPPSTPSQTTKIRKGSVASIISSPPSLTHSCETTPESRGNTPLVFSSPLNKNLPKLPLLDYGLSNQQTKPFSLMNIDQLLQVLPELEAEQITDEWMMAAEKEFAKLRGFVFAFNLSNNAYHAGLGPFCKELEGVLTHVQIICENQNEEFQRAQEATDRNKLSDLAKVSNANGHLSYGLRLLPPVGSEEKIRTADFDTVKSILLECIQVTSGVVRNQMTFQLHQQCGGLPDSLIRLLRNFDNGPSVQQQRSHRCHIRTDPIAETEEHINELPGDEPVFHKNDDDKANAQKLIEVSTSIQLQHNNPPSNTLLVPAPISASASAPDLSTASAPTETHEINESYFDTDSIYDDVTISSESAYSDHIATEDSVSDYEERITTFDLEQESVKLVIRAPAPTRKNSFGPTLPPRRHSVAALHQAKPLTRDIPPVPPVPAIHKQHRCDDEENVSPTSTTPPSLPLRPSPPPPLPPAPTTLPPSPPISPTPTPPAPPSPHDRHQTFSPLTLHPPSQNQQQYRHDLLLATRNSQIDELRRQVTTLEAHNTLLRDHIEGFVQQVETPGKGWKLGVGVDKLRASLGVAAAGVVREGRGAMGMNMGYVGVGGRRRWGSVGC